MSDAVQDAVTDALWRNVCEEFESDKAHQAFLSHCRAEDCLADAARLYRGHKSTLNEDQVEERKAVDKRLAAVALLAMSQLDAQRRTPKKSRGSRILAVIAAVIAVASILGFAQAMLG